jgi:hypothetical protein
MCGKQENKLCEIQLQENKEMERKSGSLTNSVVVPLDMGQAFLQPLAISGDELGGQLDPAMKEFVEIDRGREEKKQGLVEQLSRKNMESAGERREWKSKKLGKVFKGNTG